VCVRVCDSKESVSDSQAVQIKGKEMERRHLKLGT